MQLVTNLDNANDIRASVEFLTKHLAPTAAAGETALEDLRSRIGNSLSHIVQTTTKYGDWADIDTLARDLGRDYRSVRASLNGPLARAFSSVKKVHPGAPDLFEWRKKGTHFEFRLTPEMRAAIKARPLEFDTMPEAK